MTGSQAGRVKYGPSRPSSSVLRDEKRCVALSPWQALGSWRARSGLEVDLARCDRLAATVAAEVWADAAAARGVEGEPRGPVGRRVVAIAPFEQDDQGRAEFSFLVREDVLRSAGTLWVGNAFEHVLVAEQLEAVGERVRGDPEALLEVLEPGQAQHGVAQDQQRPAFSDHFQRPGDRADLAWIVALEHE